jgi:hypothetical protein
MMAMAFRIYNTRTGRLVARHAADVQSTGPAKSGIAATTVISTRTSGAYISA